MACLTKHLENAASPAWSEENLIWNIKAVGDVGQALAGIAAADLISAVGNFSRIPAIQDKLLGAQLQLHHTALSFATLMSSCPAAAAAACAFLDRAAALVYRLQASSSTVCDVLQELAGMQEQAVQQRCICSKLQQAMHALHGQATNHAQELVDGIQALHNLGAQARVQRYRWKLLQGLKCMLAGKPHASRAPWAPTVTTTIKAAPAATSSSSSSSGAACSSTADQFDADDAICYIGAQPGCIHCLAKALAQHLKHQ